MNHAIIKLITIPILFLIGCQQSTIQIQPKTEPVTQEPVTVNQKLEQGYSFDFQGTPQENVYFRSNEGKITMDEKSAKFLFEKKETITSINVPTDAKDQNTVYLSTTTASDTNTKYTNHIYSYNLKTQTLEELYKNDNTTWRGQDYLTVMKTIGREGSKILIIRDGLYYKPEVCESIWTYNKDITYLDITNPKQGLFTYEPPKEVLDKAAITQKECEQAKEEEA